MIRYRPERADEVIGLDDAAGASSARCSSGSASSAQRRRRRRADLARARRDARDRRGRGGRALPARRRAVHAAAAPRDVRRADAASSGCGAASRTCSSGSGCSEAYTPSLRPDDPTRARSRLPEPISAELAVLRTTPAAEPRRGGAPQRRRSAPTTIALFEIARVYLPADEPARRARRTSPAIVDGGCRRGEGDRRARSTPRSRSSRRFERASDAAAPSRQGGATAAGRRRRAAPGACSTALGRVRARPRRSCSQAARERGALRGRRSRFPPVQPGSRLRRRRGGAAPASSSPPRARRPGAELREMRPFDVYRGEQVGEGRKSIAFAVTLPVARADAHRRGRGGAARADRRGAARALRRRAPSLERCGASRSASATSTLRWISGCSSSSRRNDAVGDHERAHRRGRGHRGGPRRVLDERDLAEEVAGTELVDRSARPWSRRPRPRAARRTRGRARPAASAPCPRRGRSRRRAARSARARRASSRRTAAPA